MKMMYCNVLWPLKMYVQNEKYFGEEATPNQTLANGLQPLLPPPPQPPISSHSRPSSPPIQNLAKGPPSHFVKKLDEIPKVPVHPSSSRLFSLRLVENGLIDQFMGLWPSPREMKQWLEKNWKKMIKGKMSSTFCGKGFYAFLFENQADKDLIFRNGPYFMDQEECI
jgi:hypothetical protein